MTAFPQNQKQPRVYLSACPHRPDEEPALYAAQEYAWDHGYPIFDKFWAALQLGGLDRDPSTREQCSREAAKALYIANIDELREQENASEEMKRFFRACRNAQRMGVDSFAQVQSLLKGLRVTASREDWVRMVEGLVELSDRHVALER